MAIVAISGRSIMVLVEGVGVRGGTELFPGATTLVAADVACEMVAGDAAPVGPSCPFAATVLNGVVSEVL